MGFAPSSTSPFPSLSVTSPRLHTWTRVHSHVLVCSYKLAKDRHARTHYERERGGGGGGGAVLIKELEAEWVEERLRN